MEKLKENSEIDIENLENQNKPKLLYRLDKRNPFYVITNLLMNFLLFTIPLMFIIYGNLVSMLISLIFAFWIIWFILSNILFEYIEIYDDKIIISKYYNRKIIFSSEIKSTKDIGGMISWLLGNDLLIKTKNKFPSNLNFILALTDKQIWEIENLIQTLFLRRNNAN